jgi:cytochrome P450
MIRPAVRHERPGAGGAAGGDSPPAALVRLSAVETCAFLALVALPTWMKGILIRRRPAVALAVALQTDRVAVRHIARLRARRGAGPLVMRLPGRDQAIVLHPKDVRRVLEETPEPFSAASREKRAALSHFEPDNVLISEGPERAVRRRLHERALESDRTTHSMADQFSGLVEATADALAAPGLIDWRRFSAAWMRLTRQLVLGSSAADDMHLTALLNTLRGAANWAFLMPQRKRLRAEFHARVQAYVERAEPGALTARVAALDPSTAVNPADQIAQWLFAFEAAGIATFRAMAVLATHPDSMARARAEARAPIGEQPYLRACIVESVRLWPTTPAILRQARRTTSWRGGDLPQGAGFLIFTPFLNRDYERLPLADRWAPEQWLGRDPAENGALVPFSAGPAKCPGRHLVSLLGGNLLGAVMTRGELMLRRGTKMSPERPAPGTLDHFALAFELSPRGAPSLHPGRDHAS